MDLRRRGHSFPTIARKVGTSIATAYRDVVEGMAEIIREPATELLTLEPERLDQLSTGVYASARSGLSIMGSHGGWKLNFSRSARRNSETTLWILIWVQCISTRARKKSPHVSKDGRKRPFNPSGLAWASPMPILARPALPARVGSLCVSLLAWAQ
jgi:hypothetical protein